MELHRIDPFLRFAAAMRYPQNFNGKLLQVSDCRIFYITEGSARLHIADRQYALEPGALFYCCAGSRYTVETAACSMICLNFDLSDRYRDQKRPLPVVGAPEKWASMAVFFDEVESSGFLNSHLYLSEGHDLQPRLNRIVEAYALGTDLDMAQSCTELKLLLLELHRLHRGQLPPKIAQVAAYIREHYAEAVTNKHLAQLVGYHEYYLNRIFTEATGQSLHSFLLQERLRRAVYLILNTELELKSVAEQTGFFGYPHFSSYFKQIYGDSPAEFRKRAKNSI